MYLRIVAVSVTCVGRVECGEGVGVGWGELSYYMSDIQNNRLITKNLKVKLKAFFLDCSGNI